MKRLAIGLGWILVACNGSAPAPVSTVPAPAPSASEARPIASAEPEQPPRAPEPAPEDAGPAPAIATAEPPPAPVEKPLTPETLALKAACSKRQALACDELGAKLREVGRLVEVREAYAASCALSLAAGCGHHAWALEEGIGGAAEPEKGKALHERACKMGHAPSCERLGQLADRATDGKTALRFWSRACDLRGGSACRQTGEHYRDGVGTPVRLRTGSARLHACV